MLRDLGVLWGPPMQEFVHKANIAEFCKLLSTTTDDYQRRTLLQLLAEEEANAPPVIKEFCPQSKHSGIL